MKIINILNHVYKYINIIKCFELVSCVCKGFPLRTFFLCDIPILTVPKTTVFNHPLGIVIRRDAEIGEHCVFQGCATIGHKNNKEKAVQIGNNVIFGAHCIILGSIVIGNNVIIGAGALVMKDIPDNTTVVGVWK